MIAPVPSRPLACADDSVVFVMAPLVLAMDVPRTADHMAHLCTTRQFQVLQNELANVIAVVPFPDALRHFALCIEFHIQSASVNWTAYLNTLIRFLDDESKHSPNNMPPDDVRNVATSIFLKHLANLPSHVQATVSWCRLYHVDASHLVDGVMTLLHKNSRAALDMIQNMSLVPHLPSEIVMRHLLRRKDVECADRFVWNDPVRQRDLVRLMIDMRIDDKLIKKRLTKFKIPPTDFPDFVERRRRATLRFLVHAQQYGDIPDAAGASPAARIYAANLLYEQCGFDNPVTRHIVHLFGLGRRFPDVVALAASSFDLGANKDDPPPLPGFLTLETFHATVEFVDTVKAATTAAAYLSNELYVGLDTEWRSSFDASEAATTPCAVLQLASSTRIFVIDLLSRQNGPAILAAFKPLLASDKVLKVGLDVSGDFRALGVRPAHQILDLQTVHKALHGHEAPLTGAKTSLNDLSIAYLGLPLDKRPRMSNWARRPLTTSQLNYAALDALAPLCIYFAMKQAADQSTSHKSAKTSHRGAPHNLFGARWTYSIS